jgi:hypothetical protein
LTAVAPVAKKTVKAEAGSEGPAASPQQLAESEAFLASLARRELDGQVDDDLMLYRQHGSGLALWRAYEVCRAAGEPIPEEILLCFDEMARALGVANTAKQVAAAVQMSGQPGRSARARLTELDRLSHLLSQIHLLVTLPRPFGINAACKRVADARGLDWTSLKRAYNRARRKPAPKPKAVRSVWEWGHD